MTKKIGPKEAELRALREHKTDSVEIPTDVSDEIEAAMQRQREAFDAPLTAKRDELVKVATLKAERASVQRAWNEAEQRLRDIDKELAKLTGKVAPILPTSGGRTRRNAEQMDAERKELAAAGTKLYGILRKAGEGVDVLGSDMKADVLGVNVGKALKPYLDSKLVRVKIDGRWTKYSFHKEGELPK